MTVLPIHPFPARMAPEIALAHCETLEAGSVVLDPMAGSGTVLRAAADRRLRAVGFDLDPLAVLMSRVWLTPVETEEILRVAETLVVEASRLRIQETRLPWIDDDQPTAEFIDYWFAASQRADLRRLSFLLVDREGPIADALRLALSRIIITKDRGASLARDVSHSRPHRVRKEDDFDVLWEFLRSTDRLCRRLKSQPPPGNASVEIGDARNMTAIPESSVDAVITSPPYLNAIDYIRGHRLSLVWLGYRVGELRTIRAESVGTERQLATRDDLLIAAELADALGGADELPVRDQRMIERYVVDLASVFREMRRVLKPGGRATLVVGNSCLRGVFVDNARAATITASRSGLQLVSRVDRALPPSRRYLPPPADLSSSSLRKRMRTETVLSFVG